MKRLALVGLIGAVIGFGLGAAKRKSDPMAEILKADEDFSRVTSERGIDGFASFIAEDFHTIRPNSPIIGKKDIVATWTDLLLEKTE